MADTLNGSYVPDHFALRELAGQIYHSYPAHRFSIWSSTSFAILWPWRAIAPSRVAPMGRPTQPPGGVARGSYSVRFQGIHLSRLRLGERPELQRMELTALQLAELLVLGFFAGNVGALTGIGGGIIITPVLTLLFRVPIHQAVGTSLCCVIATSSGAAATYVEHHLSDIRLGMTLELATTVGAVSGAFVAAALSREALSVLFALLLGYAGATMVRRALRAEIADPSGVEPYRIGVEPYRIKRLPLGMCGSGVAGMISGLLGVGGGPIKVPLMYLVMGVPFKVASATSNFMMGVTAAASAFIYYSRGDVRPLITAPTAVGVFVGASLGSRIMRRAPSGWLTVLFSVIMFYFAGMMIWKSLHGGFAR